MLEFNILKGQYLNRSDKNVVSADTTDLKAQFDLTSDFAGTITVWWRRSDVDNTYTSTLAADGTCTIPAEALAATDRAVYGPYDHDVFVSISDTGRTTTNEYKLTVLRSAFSTNATPGTGGSPTAYEELVEQFDELKEENQTFKDDMTEQQETFESTVTENVNNIRYVVETETAPPIIEEASGAEITLDDSAYRQVRGLNLYGYSKQVQTTGAQLIRYPYLQRDGFTSNGITYTVTDDGVIIANGTATEESFFFMATEESDWRPSGEVFLSGCPSGGSLTTYKLQMYNYNSEGTIASDSGEGAAVNFTSTDGFWNLCIRIAPGYTANNLVFKPMLNAGTSALPWEPYSGGYASPSPDWAQPITSVGDGGSVTVESAGANLFDVSKMLNVSNFEAEQNGEYTIFKATTSGTGIFFFAQVPIDGAKDGSKYTISRNNISMVGSYFYLRNQNANGSALNPPDPISNVKEKLSGATLFAVTNPFGNGNAAVQNGQVAMAKDIIVNRGSTPLPWQPYVAPSSALIALTDSLRGVPVSSGGNYTDESGQQWIADYIYRRQTDGKWMIWRNCGSIAYDGSEDEAWSQSPSVSYRFIINGSTSPALAAAIASSFKVSTKVTTDVGKFVVNDGNNSRYFNSNQNSLEAWKAWLAENPQTVVYQLATPTVEELPENVQTELNGLYTYNLHTDMWNNDGAYMNLKYVADTKTWINNKIAGLSTAMLNQN